MFLNMSCTSELSLAGSRVWPDVSAPMLKLKLSISRLSDEDR